MVPVAEITSAENDGNLNLPCYIDSSKQEDLQDIEAHLKGGIPAADIDALVALLGSHAWTSRGTAEASVSVLGECGRSYCNNFA